ncbi:hypothetical protein ACN5LI_003918 [Cronobacter turicensis]|uniref:hypothetical protein n=1 Tax=Cronobacter turicensis TaxID=413502 RepID=UPI0024C3FCC7|nr:hypothetical protein [Cronobacter turicensis]ELY3838962.1 hypothetical protein [Cronobacter turicensis]ELY4483331.1 hypothetical protein [Cronobacter turicensis]MDK1186913.1 hypothetical protein [Cronobacter turicensis]MDK1208004.1 hypothetical protein [Cronobacter turicensis]MDK1216625.1 hypothetical protein [Cronobacter turicensis]
MYKDAISDLGAVNEHAYWTRVGEPVLNFLPGAPGLVVNIKDAITGGSQMGQATASFLNDGPDAHSAGRFLEGFLNAAGAVAGTHWGYKDSVTPSGSYSSDWQNSNIIPDKVAAQAQQDLINEINNFKSNSQAEKVAAMIGAYDLFQEKLRLVIVIKRLQQSHYTQQK